MNFSAIAVGGDAAARRTAAALYSTDEIPYQGLLFTVPSEPYE